MPRFKLTIEYDGTGFVGWQRQDSGASIQGTLEDAVLKLSGEQVTVHGAGRTDAGVHSFGQAAHFDLVKEFTSDKVRDALNHHLKPARIAVLEVEEASPDFHARFSAKARHYHYRIVCRRAPLALDEGRAWHVVRDLDADVMDIAAQTLVGHHDFTTFRSSECQAKSPVKTLDKFTVRRDGDEINFDVSARSFLHNQVRSMVGSLKLVGEGKWLASDIARALESKNRASCGPVAPPDGLYLARVDY